MGTFTKVLLLLLLFLAILLLFCIILLLISLFIFYIKKSFSGMGGYIAASKQIVDFIKISSAGTLYHNSMSPIVTQQIITALKVIMGEDGTNIGREKIQQLVDNSNYFRTKMIEIGVDVYGDYDSPIIPILIYMPAKVAAFSRECLERGVAVVVVGFPATSIFLSRARVCLSAGHTREDLEYAVKVIDELSSLYCLKYRRSMIGWGPTLYGEDC
jgi:serine palmitoyltransferase